jgi:DDE superfamily endonuclease
MVDGSLCPCWSWADAPELYSGKHKTTGHAHQVVCDLSGNLMHISDPLPGNTHDAKAMHQTGLNELLGDDNAIGDKGYIEPASPPHTANRPAESPRLAKRIQHLNQ